VNYVLNFWDVGGQKTLRSYWRNYFEATDALIFVVDSGDRRRLADAKTELHALLAEEKLAGATLLIFANKQDLPGALTVEEICTFLDLDDSLASKRHYQVLRCSGLTGEGLMQGFDFIVRDVASRIYLLD
jgi:ADP-ribosylation factor-like protein 2